MLQRLKQRDWRRAPGLALGLFCGRLLSELWPALTGSGTPVALAITLNCLTIFGAVFLLRRLDVRQTWQALLLLGYVFALEISPPIAFLVAALALIACLQVVNRRAPALRSKSAVTGGATSLALLFFVLYVVTLAPDVLTADNGELQLVATTLGIAHPPGFPLYTLIGHLATRLPLTATPAVKINLLSAVTSTLTLALVYVSAYRLTRRHLAAVTAVVALGTATTFWAQATTANVRSLTGFFAALLISVLLMFRQAIRERKQTMIQPETATTSVMAAPDRCLVFFALALGFSLTHHTSLAFMALVFVLFIIIVDPAILTAPRRWLRPILASSLGMLPLLYLPWRANALLGGANVPGASPELASFQGFLHHTLALGFRGDFFYFTEATALWERLKVMGNVMTFQFSPLLLLGMAAGLVLMVWRERTLALLLGGSFAIHTLITATYRAPQTVEYMLPAYVPAVLCLGYAAGQLEKLVRRPNGAFVALAQSWSAALLVVAVYQGLSHYPSYAILHRDMTARDYAQPLLEEAPPHATLLADWHWVTSLWYLQIVEGVRPDVMVQFVYPEGELYSETWARRIAGEWRNGRAVLATHYDETTYANLPVPEPLGEAFLFRQEPRLNLPDKFIAMTQSMGEDIELLGYHLSPETVEIGQETTLTLAWQSPGDPSPVSFFAHLIGDDGRLYAQEDPLAQPQLDGITLTQFRLTPRPGATPGQFYIVIGASLPQEDARLELATLNVTAMSQPLVSSNVTYRPLLGEPAWRRLVGYDWDQTLPNQSRLYLHWQTAEGYQTEVRDNTLGVSLDLPSYAGPWGIARRRWALGPGQPATHYVPLGQGLVWTGQATTDQVALAPGHSLDLPQRLLSSRPLTRDLVLSMRLIGYEDDGYHWAWWDLHDAVPAMGAIPTLKWIAGSYVQSPYSLAYRQQAAHSPVTRDGNLPTLSVQPAAAPGQTIGVTLRLYDAFTSRPLPILDERITNQFPWIPLGEMRLAPAG